MKRSTFSILLLVFIVATATAGASERADIIHDGHIHYNQDIWSALPARDALQLLRRAGIQRALVSATPTEGAERLYRENPDLVIPMLRPYKSIRHRYLWFKDPTLKPYLLAQLARVPYRGFGEFHVYGEDAGNRPVREMIALARERKLALHPHANLEAMKIILAQAQDITVIWAHGGFDVPAVTLRELFQQYPKLYIELSYREGMLQDGELTARWKDFLLEYPQRFLLGMDTYKASRWADLPGLADEARNWLAQLPDDVAEDIARNNLDRLFPR